MSSQHQDPSVFDDVDSNDNDNANSLPSTAVSLDKNSKSGADPNSKNSFRRIKTRSARACEVCHNRKVRCDVMVHMPCTNCAAFGVECRIPEVKRRKPKRTSKKQTEKNDSLPASSPVISKTGIQTDTSAPRPIDSGKSFVSEIKHAPHNLRHHTSPDIDDASQKLKESAKSKRKKNTSNDSANANDSATPDNESEHTDSNNGNGSSDSNPNKKSTLSYLLHAASLHDSGRVAFLGSSSNMSLLLEPQGSDTFHFPLPEEGATSSSRLADMDNEEIEILKFRGAFLLPPRDLCDDIVDAYFERIHPTIPLINRSLFMRRYNDPLNPPSLLLLQAVLLAGSRVCRNPALMDSTGSSELASLTFFKRVKALYDSNYETDRIAIVQSLILMGWWWEGPEDVTRNSFYWTRVALSVAQGFGLHRSVEKTLMPDIDKRMWKRIWWSLFLRDRWVALSLGRPVLINLEYSDVPMITEEDFNEDEPGFPSPYPPNKINSLYFIYSVKLSEIMGFVLRQHFSVDAENMRRSNKVPSVSHCDMAMVSWMQSLPEELKYKVKDSKAHNFFTALLHAQYYTVLCLVHRSNILHKQQNTNTPYPSWGIAFQAAHMIAKIMENLVQFDEARDCPAFFVYTLLSAMIMLIYQTESPVPTVVESAEKSLQMCSSALKELGRTWLVGRMVLKLFQQISKNKALRDQFVKSAHGTGEYKRHNRTFTLEKPDSNKRQKTGHFSLDMNSAQLNGQPNGQPSVSHAPQVPTGIPTLSNPPTDPPVSTSQFPTSFQQSAQMFSGNIPTHVVLPTGSSPDFSFVTNTPPQGSNFYENFQPSQLFPEQYERPLPKDVFANTLGFNGNPLNTQLPNINYSAPIGSGSNASPGDYASKSSPADDLSGTFKTHPAGSSASHAPHLPPQYPLQSPNPGMDGADIFSDIGLGFGRPNMGMSRTGSISGVTGLNSSAPSSLNLGDWYTYLTSTFPGTEDPKTATEPVGQPKKGGPSPAPGSIGKETDHDQTESPESKRTDEDDNDEEEGAPIVMKTKQVSSN